jgi:serine/threonine protein phosphatase PrpC
MSADLTERGLFFLARDLSEAELHTAASGTAAVYSTRCPDKQTANEDGALILDCGAGLGLLAVADGFGGQPAGEQAADAALHALAEAVRQALAAGGTMRAGVLDGFERANAAVTGLGVGAATTLAALEIDDGHARPYHVGDSMILIVGQRGKLKLQTVSHSPIGYVVEAGWMDEDEALHHEDRHIVSNMVGSPEMRIEVGPSLRLRPRDTVLIASDGLFDNLPVQEILEVIRKGPLEAVSKTLSAECERRMRTPDTGQPSKPDDLTFVLYRLRT